jgi:hypothetical protein
MAMGFLLGTDTAFDDEPATVRVTISGDMDLLSKPDWAMALAMPITIVTMGEEEFGVSTNHTALEFPASLRFRFIPEEIIRPYADVGLGAVVVLTNKTDGFLFLEDEHAGLMTRFAVGFEIGPAARGPMFLLEPVSSRTYFIGSTYTRFGIMLGGGARF